VRIEPLTTCNHKSSTVDHCATRPLMPNHNKYYLLSICSASRHLRLGSATGDLRHSALTTTVARRRPTTTTEDTRRTTKKGPDDARRVVWALSRFFFKFFPCFLYTNSWFCVFFRFYLRSKSPGRATMGGDDDKGPKRRQTRRLGHR
jgi:hypothetical protein